MPGTTPFDPRAYEDEVIKPLRRRLPHLPDDLPTRYAVDLTMDAGELRERTEAVVRLWAKIAQRAGPSGLVCTQFLREHDELARAPGTDLIDPDWWRRRERARHRQLEPEITDLAGLLRAGYGELKMITAGQLRVAAAAHGTLGDADLDRARAAAGLRVVEPIPLPTAAGMRGRFDSLTTKLIAAGVESIPRLLFPELTGFGLLRGFTVTPVPPGRTGALGPTTIAERARQLDTLPDSPAVRASREAVGMLAAEAAAGTDLVALCLFHLLGPVRAQRAEGAGARTLFALLTRTGLAPAEAARCVVSALAESADRPDPVATVTALLADGRLLAAQQAADALTGPPGEVARAAVARQRAEVDRLRRLAIEHLRAGEHEPAGDRLREALRQGVDLPGLAAELDRIPAAAVLAVRATPDGPGVRISWRPAPEHTTDTVFLVRRGPIVAGIARPPADAGDGTDIPVRPGTDGPVTADPVAADPVALDPAPPVGRELRYAVFARNPAGPWSRPTVATAPPVVPPVVDVQVEGDTGAITGRWRAHPEVAGVEVRRHAGEPTGPGDPIAVHEHREFRDETARDGIWYCYTIVAGYPPVEPGGPVLRAEPVLARAATRPEPRPVRVLTAAAVIDPDRLAVRLSWRQQAGSEIVVRWAGRPCPWPYGQLVPVADLTTWGQPLGGERRERGDAVTLLAALPAGRAHCVPFTLGPDGGLRGQDAVVDLIHPVRRVQARRFGDDLLVSWVWPDAAGAAEVSWDGGCRLITPIAYREEGGCLLRGIGGVTRVEVSAVVLDAVGNGMVAGDAVGRAPAVAVPVAPRPPRIGYRLHRRGHRLTGGVRCEVTLSADEPVPEVTVLLVAAAGAVLPGSPAAGIELLRASVRLEPGAAVRLEAPVPPLRRPYWLRCFLTDPAAAVLVDPPVTQLMVS